MSFFARTFFVILHIVEIVILITLLKEYHFVDPALYEAVKKEGSLDTLSVASQLGRFDMISMILAMIGMFITLAAIFAFLEIRTRSVRIAEETAKEEAASTAERVAKEAAEQKLGPATNRIIEEYFSTRGIDVNRLAIEYGMLPRGDDNIASALEGDKH